jgi:hypothetical protein
MVRQAERENYVNSNRFNHGTESLTKINASLLSEAVQYPTSFETIKRTICMKLVVKYPFVGYNVHARRTWNQSPGVIGLEGRKFCSHSITPIGISQGTAARLQQW